MIKETRARRLRVGLVLVHHHPGASRRHVTLTSHAQNRNSWSRGKMAIASDGYKALIVLSCVMWVVSIMLFSSIPSHNDNGALPTQVFPASASAHA